MQQSEYLLPAPQHLPDFLEQEPQAWQGHDLGRLGGGWAADEGGSWSLQAGNPPTGDPRAASQVCLCYPKHILRSGI